MRVPVLSPGLGYRRGILPPRSGPARAIVVHTTGGGILARYRREGAAKGDATPHDTAVRVYTRIMPASGHYVVGQASEVVQVVPETHVAHHVGGAGSGPYARARWGSAEHDWWRERWPGLASPRDLAGGLLWAPGVASVGKPAAAGCNANTIGIEVVPPLAGATRPWSDECWAALAALVADVAERHAIPLEREYVITHSDAHPLSRTARGQPWDVAPSQWTWERMAAELSR